ncbi:type I addiction module toxin, SymE family [Pectobacterium versatile]|uniref:SymE family type I addiction module toxin n=1 Tax=Pectobacterium versatile TaxID=2488639 RepID=UPI001B396812|nr:SymE family type I addiction module toxin [Pectobacterium versatile]MBQ4769781.1 type I addiction module toxin, SymE family [Pectobacterium versatile]
MNSNWNRNIQETITNNTLILKAHLHFGNWLEAAGFGTDTPAVITVEYGQLLIRIVAE